MKRSMCFACIMIFFSVLAFSQDYKGKGRVTGTVADEQGNPLEGVTVKLMHVKLKSGFEVVTNDKGVWKASWIKGGTWYIDFLKPGYDPRNISVELYELRQNPPIELTLKKGEELVLTDTLKEDFQKGNTLYEEGKYEEAIEVYNKILGDAPDAYIMNLNIGNCYFQMEDYNQAEEYYMKVLEKEPENTKILQAIGNCYSNRGDTVKALEWYNKIEIDKIDDPIVLYNIGTHFYGASQFNDALKYYAKSVEVKEDFLDGIYQLGLVNLAMGNNAQALSQFENYIKHDPDSERASQVRGFIEFLKKKLKGKALS